MGKKIIITEKPSVAMEFAKVVSNNFTRRDGYLESEEWIITWCVGHLVTMSYPEKYNEQLKYWRIETLPFIPKDWKYEIIPQVEKQFNIIKSWYKEEKLIELLHCDYYGHQDKDTPGSILWKNTIDKRRTERTGISGGYVTKEIE